VGGWRWSSLDKIRKDLIKILRLLKQTGNTKAKAQTYYLSLGFSFTGYAINK
jgi:hypothetical protein